MRANWVISKVDGLLLVVNEDHQYCGYFKCADHQYCGYFKRGRRIKSQMPYTLI